MDTSPLRLLPDELLEAIVFDLPPAATLAFGKTCKRSNKIAYEHLVWRAHCLREWRYWEARHEVQEKIEQPPAQVKWRHIYNERKRVDKKALELFEDALQTQQHRVARIEEIAKLGYDVKDVLVKQKDRTNDDAEDVLARRYFAGVVLGRVHRMTALDKWTRLQKRQMISLEDALGAFDLFVLTGPKGDLNDINAEFSRLANDIRETDFDFDELSSREKAKRIASYLRTKELVGNPSEEDYHALRNNFISMALFNEVHTSLPLQSVAIYCAVARRLGVKAKPSNYPGHVHAVIEAPDDQTLDGKPRIPVDGAEPEIMHMDPWRSAEEVPREHLIVRLQHMAIAPNRHAESLGAAKVLELTLRTGRNIMNSVQETRERLRGTSRRPPYPDPEAAWYSMIWSMMLLGDSNGGISLHRRRQCLPYLADHITNHFPEDIGFVESLVVPMFEGEREFQTLMLMINEKRAGDRNAKAPHPRTEGMNVRYNVGHLFQHKRYGYEGVIIGWTPKCQADPRWVSQMRVDDLPRGQEQPFYNVLADDKSIRYVAEENIERLWLRPCDVLMELAGRYFKRWDAGRKSFVSNIKDEYPDD